MSTTRLQMRGDSSANWTSANPVLAEREMGLETDTNKFKVGDGSLAWTALSYYNYADSIILTGGTNITISDGYSIALDASIDLTSMSADTIYSGATDVSTLFAAAGTVPTTYEYDLVVAATDETTAITTGAAKVTFYAPNNFTLTGASATLTTAGSTSSVVDLNYNASTVFASPITLASGIYYNTSATTTTAIVRYGKFTVDIDTAGTGAAGLKVMLLGYKSF